MTRRKGLNASLKNNRNQPLWEKRLLWSRSLGQSLKSTAIVMSQTNVFSNCVALLCSEEEETGRCKHNETSWLSFKTPSPKCFLPATSQCLSNSLAKVTLTLTFKVSPTPAWWIPNSWATFKAGRDLDPSKFSKFLIYSPFCESSVKGQEQFLFPPLGCSPDFPSGAGGKELICQCRRHTPVADSCQCMAKTTTVL